MTHGKFVLRDGREIELNLSPSPLLIGSTSECDIQIRNESVGKLHCRLEFDKECVQVVVVPLSPYHHTYKNSQSLMIREKEALEHNDVLIIANKKFRFLESQHLREIRRKQSKVKRKISTITHRITRSAYKKMKHIEDYYDTSNTAAIPPLLSQLQKDDLKRVQCTIILDPLMDERNAYKARKESWTEEEIEILHEKWKIYPKNMRLIKQFLPNKSVYDIIQYYYDNKFRDEELQVKTKSTKVNYMSSRKPRSTENLSFVKVESNSVSNDIHHAPTTPVEEVEPVPIKDENVSFEETEPVALLS